MIEREDPTIEYAGTACRPPISAQKFMSDVAAKIDALEDKVKAEVEDGGVPWFDLRLPWEKEPPYWRHPILHRRWRRMHYRIVSLECEAGIHDKQPQDVLPWVYRDDLGYY